MAELLTLSEVSNRTNISMPTLQRYKKDFQDRIPSEGKGRRQRYPVEALAVFEQIKKENVKKRGRPRKNADAKPKAATKAPTKAKRKPGRPAKQGKAAAAEAKSGELLTLTQIGEMTGISYPTLSRYVKAHLSEIPHEGKGRKRRYLPEAVAVFQRIYQEGGRGGGKKAAAKARAAKPAATKAAKAPRKTAAATPAGAVAGDAKLGKRIESLERSQENLEKQIKELVQLVRKPLTVTIQRAK